MKLDCLGIFELRYDLIVIIVKKIMAIFIMKKDPYVRVIIIDNEFQSESLNFALQIMIFL